MAMTLAQSAMQEANQLYNSRQGSNSMIGKIAGAPVQRSAPQPAFNPFASLGKALQQGAQSLSGSIQSMLHPQQKIQSPIAQQPMRPPMQNVRPVAQSGQNVLGANTYRPPVQPVRPTPVAQVASMNPASQQLFQQQMQHMNAMRLAQVAGQQHFQNTGNSQQAAQVAQQIYTRAMGIPQAGITPQYQTPNNYAQRGFIQQQPTARPISPLQGTGNPALSQQYINALNQAQQHYQTLQRANTPFTYSYVNALPANTNSPQGFGEQSNDISGVIGNSGISQEVLNFFAPSQQGNVLSGRF